MKNMFSKILYSKSNSNCNPHRLKIALLPILIFCTVVSSAQWNNVNVGTTEGLYSVDYHSMNDIWVGGNDVIALTSNNGSSWTVFDPVVDNFGVIIPSIIQDIEVRSSTSALSTGLIYFSNSESILSTVNSAANWNTVWAFSGGALPRRINALDFNGSVYLAVGHKGRIVRDANAGTNWNLITSSTTNHLYDVKFINATNAIAGGEQIVLLSNDAGQTWTSATFQTTITSISCPLNCIYFGTTTTDSIYKSINGGVSFTSVYLPFESNGILHAISEDTVIVSGRDGLYITYDGGNLWEKYILNGYHNIRMMDFLNAQQGFAVGDSGFVIRTSNLSQCPSVPIPSFTIKGQNFCLGDTLLLINETVNYPGYTYAWQLNGTTISTQYNANYVLTDTGTINVSLIVTNQDGSSTLSDQINVIGHVIRPFILESSNIICPGNIARFIIPNSQAGVTYKLREGFVIIGNSKIGNGDTLTFQTQQIVLAQTTYNVIGIFSNFCFTDSIIRTATINIGSGGPKVNCSAMTSGTKWISNVMFNTINNTPLFPDAMFTDYSCNLNTDVITGNTYAMNITTNGSIRCSAWIDLDTSGTFTNDEALFNQLTSQGNFTTQVIIPTVPLLFDIPLRLRIIVKETNLLNDNPCFSNSNSDGEDYSVTIRHAPVAPTSSFTYTSSVVCSTAVTFTNTTFNGENYYWDFGDGDTSNLLNPIHTYAFTGTYLVSLISGNVFGTDTSTQMVVIQNPLVPVTSCEPTEYQFACDDLFVDGLQVSGPGITSFSYTTPYNGPFKLDYTCTRQVQLMADSSYSIYFAGRFTGTTNCGGWKCAWIDWNNNGTLDDPGEKLNNGNAGGCNLFIYFTVPSTATFHTPLRARAAVSDNNIFSSCDVLCGGFLDFTAFVDTGGTTGIENINPANSLLNIFPNPGSGVFTFESTGGELEIYSYTGAILYKKKIEAGTHEIDLSELADGCYHLSLVIGNSRVRKTLIVIKN